jgi:hypothetical protein
MQPVMRLAVLAVVAPVLLAVAHPAFASPPSMTDPVVTPTPPPKESNVAPRNPRTATALAVVGALLGPAMMMSATKLENNGQNEKAANALGLGGAFVMLVGPSWGHWYGGKALTGGLGLRALGMGMVMVGAVMMVSCIFDEGDCPEETAAGLLFLGGSGSYVAGTVWDLATAAKQVRKWNAEHVSVTPMAMRTDRGAAAGLALSGSF